MDAKVEKYPDTHHDPYSKTVFGFWLYLLTDFILFGVLFATYAVLEKSTFGGESAKELFSHTAALEKSFVLLFCSFFAGAAGAFAHRKNKKSSLFSFLLTMGLGILFMAMEWAEFSRLIQTGNGWEKNAFLSAYFTLAGTHWLHLFFAVLWTIVLCIPVMLYDITPRSLQRLTCLKMFWQFLNIVWIFIFTIVYLMGEIQ